MLKTKKTSIAKYPYYQYHIKLLLDGYDREDATSNLKTGYLGEVRCGTCLKIIANDETIAEQEKVIKTMFDGKYPLFT